MAGIDKQSGSPEASERSPLVRIAHATVRIYKEQMGRGPVEEITGRRVRSFVSGIDVEEDISIETFVLHPENADVTDKEATR
jgi:uncharacterized protein YbcI